MHAECLGRRQQATERVVDLMRHCGRDAADGCHPLRRHRTSLGGQLDVVFSNMPESIAHVKSGKLRALAIASSARHPLVPEVPTTAEAGMAALQVESWTALMAPA